MKRSEANLWRKKIENAASFTNDETALDSIELFPRWESNKEYEVGFRVQYDAVLYKCVQAHRSQDDWTPSETPALWVVVSVEEFPEWVQPIGSQDAYNTGDKVSFNDKHWISTVDGNVWQPGVYGWDEVIE